MKIKIKILHHFNKLCDLLTTMRSGPDGFQSPTTDFNTFSSISQFAFLDLKSQKAT